MSRRAACLLASLLAACGHTPLPVPERVEVPVPIACVSELVPKPDLPSDQELAAMDSYHGILALWLDRRARQIYEARLEAAMSGCWVRGRGGT